MSNSAQTAICFRLTVPLPNSLCPMSVAVQKRVDNRSIDAKPRPTNYIALKQHISGIFIYLCSFLDMFYLRT